MELSRTYLLVTACAAVLTAGVAHGRVKLAALPARADTVIRLDNPNATLIQEERVLTLQKGRNSVDFSWKGVSIDADSIRLQPLSHPDDVTLLSVSYPPDEAALMWTINASAAYEERVRISYLLSGLDRLVAYKGTADQAESELDLNGYLVLRNFSGEDFAQAAVQLEEGAPLETSLQHEETRRLRYLNPGQIPITKIWTFDARKLPWDPEKVDGTVGIPVTYEIENNEQNGLGKHPLRSGKVRLYQHDGHESTIFLGEDRTSLVPVGEKTELSVGDSRDIVVTQRKMRERRLVRRRNDHGKVVLYDTDEVIHAEIENFKDSAATLKLIQRIPHEWEMESCNMDYELKDWQTLVFTVSLPPRGRRELRMHYHRRNVR